MPGVLSFGVVQRRRGWMRRILRTLWRLMCQARPYASACGGFARPTLGGSASKPSRSTVPRELGTQRKTSTRKGCLFTGSKLKWRGSGARKPGHPKKSCSTTRPTCQQRMLLALLQPASLLMGHLC
ncbi:unnamed protein product [Symbiodinium natans]|uniref:Uncharacterized protein n=1 Tax=Symbiodinium natans TaxID=878477 RepID=A0A812NEA3_9DINO|nr:unnamed protein product [Symbiodinium natans]